MCDQARIEPVDAPENVSEQPAPRGSIAIAIATALSTSLDASAQSAEPVADGTPNTTGSRATAEELALIRAQLQNILQRVDRLEAENQQLQAENSQLRRQAEPAPVAAAQPADWPSRISVKGDIRYRYQYSDDESAAATRDEDLLRARLTVQAEVNDRMAATVSVATSSSPGNPRGANVQLDGSFSRKSLYLNLAYFDWTMAEGAHLLGGKMKIPFERPGDSLFWDNDVNPEGLAVTYDVGSWFGSAWSFWIEENVESGTATPTATSADTRMYGLQLGNRFEVGSDRLVVAASYYDLASAQGRRPFYNGNANGNSLSATGGLLHDFRVVDVMAEYDTSIGGVPLQVWGDYAKNLAARLDAAYAVGASVGSASLPGTWEAGVLYQVLEKDALFAQHIDSDFGGGVSDLDGWMLRAGYVPLKNWLLNATYFKSDNNREVGAGYGFDRLMLDFTTWF